MILAPVLLAMGQRDRAVAELQRAIDAQCPWRWLAPYDPRLASLCESDVMRELKRPALRAACASVNEEGTRA